MSRPAGSDRLPILIVGAGPVGLALANDLGQRQIPCVIVEKDPAHSPIPKMNHVNIRSMELCRRWGLADRVRHCGWPDDHPMDVAYITRLGGFEVARFRLPSHRDRAAPSYTPEPSQRCPQLWFDPILEEGLSSYAHVELRRGVELESFEETARGVRARVCVNGGVAEDIHASFVVGADGANSRVRSIAAIERESWGPSPWQVAISLRIKNFAAIQPSRAAFFFVLCDNGTRAVLTSTDGEELWRFNWNVPAGEEPDDLDPHDAIRQIAGPDLEYEIVAVMPWQIRFTLASSYRRGRVFLAGDAARTLSPTGGLGMNTGLADAADLGWKLAAYRDGWGGEALLDSYDAERRAAGRAINEESLRNLSRVASIPALSGIAAEDSRGARTREEVRRALEDGDFILEWKNDGAVLGGCYEASPVIPRPAGKPPTYDPNDYRPSAWPGCRAPHAWLPDGRSTLDLFGAGFVLLRIGPSAAHCDSLAKAAETLGLPFEAVALPEKTSADGVDLAQLYGAPLVLVRPDGIVAWRGVAAPANPEQFVNLIRGATSAGDIRP